MISCGDYLCILYVFVDITSYLEKELFKQYYCSYYGSPLWPLQSDGVESLCVVSRKALRIICRVHPQTHCDVIAALSCQKPLILSLRARFVNNFNKFFENDDNVVKSVAFISRSNPMSCAGNNYRMLLNVRYELTIEGLSVWNERCCKLNDSINVTKEMVDVRDEFKECQVERRWKNS